MTTLTPEQRQAALEAGDAPVAISDPQTGASYFLVKAEVFERMREILESGEDPRESESWGRLVRRARDHWATENPY